jgi:hypothetical protein
MNPPSLPAQLRAAGQLDRRAVVSSRESSGRFPLPEWVVSAIQEQHVLAHLFGVYGDAPSSRNARWFRRQASTARSLSQAQCPQSHRQDHPRSVEGPRPACRPTEGDWPLGPGCGDTRSPESTPATAVPPMIGLGDPSLSDAERPARWHAPAAHGVGWGGECAWPMNWPTPLLAHSPPGS